MKCDYCLMTEKELKKQYPAKNIKFTTLKEFNVCSECLKDTPKDVILQNLIYDSTVTSL